MYKVRQVSRSEFELRTLKIIVEGSGAAGANHIYNLQLPRCRSLPVNIIVQSHMALWYLVATCPVPIRANGLLRHRPFYYAKNKLQGGFFRVVF